MRLSRENNMYDYSKFFPFFFCCFSLERGPISANSNWSKSLLIGSLMSEKQSYDFCLNFWRLSASIASLQREHDHVIRSALQGSINLGVWAVLVITFSYKSSIVMAAKIPAKKRKVDQENRVFKEEWTDKYFFIERKNKAISA